MKLTSTFDLLEARHSLEDARELVTEAARRVAVDARHAYRLRLIQDALTAEIDLATALIASRTDTRAQIQPAPRGPR